MKIQPVQGFAGKTFQAWVNWCSLVCLIVSHLIFVPQGRCQNPPKKIAIIIQGKPHTTDVTDDNPEWANDSMIRNVQQMAAALIDKGFDVKATTRWSQDLPGLQDNAPPYQTTSSFVSIVNDLKGKLGPGDQVIVYYTGHANRDFQEQPAIDTMTTNWKAYVNSGQGGQKKKDMPRNNPADLTQNYVGYMDIGGTEGGATVTTTQFATQMALLPGHKFVVIDACYAGMFKNPLIRIPGVESVYTSSRFDEPSYAGAADMIVTLNWEPPARTAPPQQTPEAALASLNLPGPAAIRDVPDRYGTITGKQLVMTRPEGENGSAFSYGFILGIKAAPNNSTTDQMLAGAFTSGWQRDPTAVAGLLDWKTTGTPYSLVNAKSHALSHTQKQWRKGHSHPSGVRRQPEGGTSAVDVPPPPGLGGAARGGGAGEGNENAGPGANKPGDGGNNPGGANSPTPPNSPAPPAPLTPRAKAQKELEDAQTAYDTARQKFDDATQKSEQTATAMSSAGSKLADAKAANPQGGADVNAAQAALNGAKADDDAASATVQTAKKDLDEKKAALDNAQSALNATPAEPSNGGGEGGAMRSQEPGETEATPVSLAGSSSSTSGFGPSVAYAPPALPVYDQPLCSEPGYIWTPGYWDYADRDYYWVPGTWVEAPQVGFLWTPGYWAWGGSAFFFHEGFWGPHVGFYGGINYGFGYGGHGYEGGRWEDNHFFYNTSVNRIDNTTIHNTYNATVENTTTVNRVSYNGGNGGINARPSAQEETYEKERHTGLVAAQNQHIREAGTNPELRASANQGKPPIAATAKPGDFKGGAVPASEAGALYKAPEGTATGKEVRPGNNTESDTNTYNHASEVQPHKYPVTSSGSASTDQRYQQQQENLAAKQNQEHQELQQQQEKEHQQVANKNASATQKQQIEQRHSKQTQELEKKHAAQQQKMQTHQSSQKSH